MYQELAGDKCQHVHAIDASNLKFTCNTQKAYPVILGAACEW